MKGPGWQESALETDVLEEFLQRYKSILSNCPTVGRVGRPVAFSAMRCQGLVARQ